MSGLRIFLALSRASGLPTVWSNCLAGWWLGGDQTISKLPFLFAGATFLYLGGAFLNDAFDAGFDRQHRRARPIPSGAVTPRTVASWGWAWLALGAGCLFCVSRVSGFLGLTLVFWILLYNTTHRLITFSPVLLGICRFFLYIIAASSGVAGATGWSIWCGLALAAYVMGLGFFARQEDMSGPVRYWALAFLPVPVFLAIVMNAGAYREAGLLLSVVLGLWIVRCLRLALWSADRDIGLTILGLFAGIVLVDWLAVADAPRWLSAVFIAFFLLSLSFQRLSHRASTNSPRVR